MANSGSTLSKASLVNDYYDRIHNPAYNSVVHWNGNYRVNRTNTGALGPRDFSEALSAGNLTNDIIATNILSQVKGYALYTTVARRALTGIYIDDFSPDYAGYWYDESINITRLTDAYVLGFSYTSDSNLQSGNIMTATGMNAFLDAVRSVASQAQSSGAYQVDLRICHSSCHSSCHGSRGRR